MYNQAKSCVRHFGSLSDFFKRDVGLLQGEIIYPILFSLFLADLETFLQIDADAGITLEHISIYLLMFADDAAFFPKQWKDCRHLLIILGNIAINGISQ